MNSCTDVTFKASELVGRELLNRYFPKNESQPLTATQLVASAKFAADVAAGKYPNNQDSKNNKRQYSNADCDTVDSDVVNNVDSLSAKRIRLEEQAEKTSDQQLLLLLLSLKNSHTVSELPATVDTVHEASGSEEREETDLLNKNFRNDRDVQVINKTTQTHRRIVRAKSPKCPEAIEDIGKKLNNLSMNKKGQELEGPQYSTEEETTDEYDTLYDTLTEPERIKLRSREVLNMAKKNARSRKGLQ